VILFHSHKVIWYRLFRRRSSILSAENLQYKKLEHMNIKEIWIALEHYHNVICNCTKVIQYDYNLRRLCIHFRRTNILSANNLQNMHLINFLCHKRINSITACITGKLFPISRMWGFRKKTTKFKFQTTF
jgi:hypothetical protein